MNHRKYSTMGATIAKNLEDRATVYDVIEEAAAYFAVTVEELTGRDRAQPLASYRAVAIAAARDATGASYPALGKAFGDRDHTTALHAVLSVQGNDEAWTVARLIAIRAQKGRQGISPDQGFLFS